MSSGYRIGSIERRRKSRLRLLAKAVAVSASVILCMPENALQSAECSATENGKCVNVTRELRNVRVALETNREKLNNVQLILARMKLYTGPIDGKWTKTTEDSIRGALETYIAIGGRGPDWGINNKRDVDRFIKWLYAALESGETGNEFPD